MASKKKQPEEGEQTVIRIDKPDIRTVTLRIVGTSPYVQNKFSQKALNQIKATQEAGTQAKGKKQREPKVFEDIYEGAKHFSTEGWVGIPAASFRAAMISACRVAGLQMTKAKLSVFVQADGFDTDDGTGLVKIHGAVEMHESYVRNETQVVDIRPRPMWRRWYADVTVKWDNGQFSLESVTNLLTRAGLQVGIGEGRPDSKRSAGCGWGTFEVVEANPDPAVPPEGFEEETSEAAE